MIFFGVDISKLSFDVTVIAGDKNHHKKFDNVQKGFKLFCQWMKSFESESIICMESSNIYPFKLAQYLYQHKYAVIIANPLKTYHFNTMQLCRNKTDKADSLSIAKYTKYLYDNDDINKHLFKPQHPSCQKLKALITRLEQLKKNKSQELTRLESTVDKTCKTFINKDIKYLEKQIKQLLEIIQKHVDSNENLYRQTQLLISIDGIGNQTAWTILAYLGNVSHFSNASQVASFCGLNPSMRQSGTSLNKTSISKVGNKKLRKALYMPAIVAKKHNPILSEFYQRMLQKGKPKKVALCAVMRKLLVIAFGVLKSGQKFEQNYRLNKC